MKTSFLFFIILVLLFLAGGAVWWFWASNSVCQTDCPSKIFLVNKGEGLGSIAQRLEEEKLIRSSVAFQILTAQEGLTRKIQAGDFRLNPKMSPLEIAQQLTHGTLDRWVTLPEGWRREEIAEKLESELEKFNKAEFLNLTKNLEGQLFPDTYLIPKEADAQRVVSILTANFEKKTAKINLGRQTLIIASIVEREARFETDQPIIAGIFLKRLKAGWPLQADATVQYAKADVSCQLSVVSCEWWPKKLTKEDLRLKSPYNTYLSRGLPPAPISNPGLATIKAALNPQETDYWYYLSDNEGKMHYAKTIEEHNQNIERHLLR